MRNSGLKGKSKDEIHVIENGDGLMMQVLVAWKELMTIVRLFLETGHALDPSPKRLPTNKTGYLTERNRTGTLKKLQPT